MKPESAAFLLKSEEFLAKARSMLDHGWPDEAGRAAYLAGFHAAQALIFERIRNCASSPSALTVMAGLVPAIRTTTCATTDGRDKPGHDVWTAATARTVGVDLLAS